MLPGWIQILLGVVGLAADAVEALVVAEVEIAVLLDLRPELDHASLVAGVGGADEVVRGAVELGPGAAELLGDLVGVGLLGHALLGGDALDLQAVLVGAGEEARLLAADAVVAREHVGGDRGVGAAQVGHVVDVVDRRGDVEGARHGVALLP
jgi:hypothetical protein